MEEDDTAEQLDLFKSSSSKKMVITGASGMIGSYLTKFFQKKGWRVDPIKREDLNSDELLHRKIDGANVVINLAGENVAQGRWTPKKKKQIYDSRVDTTVKIVNVMNELAKPPEVFISASAIGYYGVYPGVIEGEENPPGKGFLANVCMNWEIKARKYTKGRTVMPRLGLVMASKGGFLDRMRLIAKFCLLGRIGSGNQMISWISIEDIAEFFQLCIENSKIEGPVNLTTPNPISNTDLVHAIAKSVKRPVALPLPESLIKFIFGEKGAALFLADQSITPKKLNEINFKFLYPNFPEYL